MPVTLSRWVAGAAGDGLPVAVGVAADAAAAAAHVMSVLVLAWGVGCPVGFRSSTEGSLAFPDWPLPASCHRSAGRALHESVALFLVCLHH